MKRKNLLNSRLSPALALLTVVIVLALTPLPRLGFFTGITGFGITALSNSSALSAKLPELILDNPPNYSNTNNNRRT